MKLLRRVALWLLCCSALLFAFLGYTMLCKPESRGLFFAHDKTLAQPQPLPLPTPVIVDDAWSQWRDVNIPTLADTYFIQHLDEDTRRLCAGIYGGIASFQEEIILPEPVDVDTLSKIMWLISYDCPELFQISGDYSYYVRENMQDMAISVKPSYVMDEEAYNAAIARVTALLSGWINDAGALNAFETEKLLYENLIKTCAYGENVTHAGSVYGALILGSARCEGYAKSLCMAMRAAGFESLILTGEARTSSSDKEARVEKHAWNVTKINGNYYQLDATWDDPDGALPFDTSYAYFNLTDEEMYRSRTLDEIYGAWPLPVCDDASLSYHAQSGSLITVAQDPGPILYALLDDSYYSEKNYIIGKFETELQMSEFKKNIKDWIKSWYRDKKFASGSYDSVTYNDSLVFTIFNLSYDE
ncbi:MAG: hypothetical protein LBS18_05020 [Clostridiales bacterium]|nr:hypothetical protein [Clostridiales bacterium]